MKAFLLPVSLAWMAGCAEHDELLSLHASDVVYTQTIIRQRSDGQWEVIHKPITLAQELAENEARAALAAGLPVAESSGLDPGCAGSSEWLYDQPGLVGNKICFSHPATNCQQHSLASIVHRHVPCPLLPFPEPVFWASLGGFGACVNPGPLNSNRVRSIWTGSSPNPGVIFFDAPSLGGAARGNFGGTFVQYPNVNTPGTVIGVCGLN